MSKLRVHAFSISIDGYGAGLNQSLENALGEGGERLHEWFVVTHAFQSEFGREGGETGPDNDLAARGVDPVLLGGGEPLFTGLNLPALGLKTVKYTGAPRAAHYIFTR